MYTPASQTWPKVLFLLGCRYNRYNPGERFQRNFSASEQADLPRIRRPKPG
jgi:hypothetical protein